MSPLMNETDEIAKALQPYYERIILSEATDPNLLYDLQPALSGADVFTAADVDAFAYLLQSESGPGAVVRSRPPAARPFRDPPPVSGRCSVPV